MESIRKSDKIILIIKNSHYGQCQHAPDDYVTPHCPHNQRKALKFRLVFFSRKCSVSHPICQPRRTNFLRNLLHCSFEP